MLLSIVSSDSSPKDRDVFSQQNNPMRINNITLKSNIIIKLAYNVILNKALIPIY